MDRIIRCITEDGSIMAAAIDSSDLVYTAQEVHHTNAVATAALGRLLTGASIMGAMLKKEDANVTVKINGGGPAGTLVAISDSHGNCRGYIENPCPERALRPDGKLDVGGIVGKDGLLAVIRDLGEGDPYIGQVQLISGEIAEDITNYYATSEQIPTVCALGVLVNKETHKAMLSGGILVQVLPGADDCAISRLEQNVALLEPVTTMLAKGYTIEEMCQKVLDGFKMEILDQSKISYICTCNKERVIRAISTLPATEIRHLADENGFMEAKCQYCNHTYRLSKQELQELADSTLKK